MAALDFNPCYDVVHLGDVTCHIVHQRQTAVEGAELTSSGKHSPASSGSWDDFNQASCLLSENTNADLCEVLHQVDAYAQPWAAVYCTYNSQTCNRDCAIIGTRDQILIYSNRRVMEVTDYLKEKHDMEDFRFQNFWVYQTHTGDYFLAWSLACADDRIATQYTVLLFDGADNVTKLGTGLINAYIKKISLFGNRLDYITNEGLSGSATFEGVVL
ncbi:hypothetical protein GMRT_13614 [Giardia muris]|uniref:Uncharacterized protein n=1 Tax=Giardia muris TaxID=5742 RepID=A0A4Z1SW85_GIAMU|nr:hypothetical protein GMRT_13614 [Giardia muris]|eukprot:TNJ30034.1 hypothetical protein GMRT_13614 [Giardia muris]